MLAIYRREKETLCDVPSYMRAIRRYERVWNSVYMKDFANELALRYLISISLISTRRLL